jgi:hypothetical protein
MSRVGTILHTVGMRSPLITTLVTLVVWGAVGVPGLAQERGHVGVLAGSSSVRADFAKGTQKAVGFTAGVRALLWLDIEGDVIMPAGEVVHDHTGTSISFAPPGSSREEVERLAVVTHFMNQRTTRSVISVGAAFHPGASSSRVMPRCFVGVVNHRVRDLRRAEHLSLPPGVTIEQVNLSIAPEEVRQWNVGGLSVGGSVAIRATPRIAIAPDVRYDYMSIGDDINNALRMSIRAHWRF